MKFRHALAPVHPPRNDLKIEVTRDSLHIRGHRSRPEHCDKARYFHRELRVQSLQRSIHLPVEVNPEKTVADLTDGMLKITMLIVDLSAYKTITVAL